MPFTTHPATPADYPEFARLFPELAVPEPTPPADRFVEAIVPDAIFLRDGADVVGYAWSRPRGDRFHIVHVITAPEHRRRGVGGALMDGVAARARAAGFRRWMLNVKPENLPARALYERLGMKVVLESVQLRLAWAAVAKLPPSPAATTIAVIPADDRRFEEALAMSDGEIAAWRALAGRILVGVESAGIPVGFTAFDPTFPGASVFRVREPEHARGLLDAVRGYALAEHDHLLLFVEGDPALAAALENAGAEVVMRALRMEGTVPATPD